MVFSGDFPWKGFSVTSHEKGYQGPLLREQKGTRGTAGTKKKVVISKVVFNGLLMMFCLNMYFDLVFACAEETKAPPKMTHGIHDIRCAGLFFGCSFCAYNWRLPSYN